MDGHIDQPVDLNVLRSRFAEIGLEESDIAELVDAFLEDTPAGLQRLAQAAAIESPSDVASAAHALKSPAATFGAMHLSELTSDLERRARAGDTGRRGGGSRCDPGGVRPRARASGGRVSRSGELNETPRALAVAGG